MSTDEEVENSEKSSESHLHALKVLANPTYHFVDAYPLLYKMYAIALAIQVGLLYCRADVLRSETRKVQIAVDNETRQIRSLAHDGGGETNNRQPLDKNLIIDTYGMSSPLLSKLLIR